MNHRVPKGIRIMAYRLFMTPGTSVRMVMREAGIGHEQALSFRRALYRCNRLPDCPCGKPSGHNGWCKWRTMRSSARVECLRKMHKYREFSLEGKDLDKAALRNSELNRAYYRRNAERIKEQKREYYLANRDKIRERVRKYRSETKAEATA